MSTPKFDIRWRMQFKTMNGTGCLVNIYTDDDSGTQIADATKTGADVPFAVEEGVKSLTGARPPIYWEERSDQNLFDLVRYKTGYLNVEEYDEHTIDGLRPTTSQARFMTVYYGSTMVFSGYLQMNDYNEDVHSFPRIAKIPIISPLGLLKILNFDYPTAQGPVTIGSVFSHIMDSMNPEAVDAQDFSHYQRIIFPSLASSADDQYAPFSGLVNPHMLCPLNSDFIANSDAPEDFVEDPLTMLDFVKGFCAGYNYILHETPYALIFTRLYYPNNTTRIYRYIDADSLTSDTLTGGTMNTIYNVSRWNTLNIAHALAKVSIGEGNLKLNVRQPKKAVKTTVAGIATSGNIETEYNLCKYAGDFGYGRMFTNLNPEISSEIWLPENEYFMESYYLALCRWADEDIEDSPLPVLHIGQNSRDHIVLSRTFYGLSIMEGDIDLEVAFDYGTSINPDDHNPSNRYFLSEDDLAEPIEFEFDFIRNGDVANRETTSIKTTKTRFTVKAINQYFHDSLSVIDTLTVRFRLVDYAPVKVHDGRYIRFKEYTLKSDHISDTYSGRGIVKQYMEEYKTGGTNDVTLNVPYSPFFASHASRSILLTYVRQTITPYTCMIPFKQATQRYVYPYMGHAQRFIKGKMLHEGMTGDDLKYYLYLYDWNLSELLNDGSTGYNWRVLSAKSYPAEDKMEVQWVLPDNNIYDL